jgi:hypothetical protein
MCSTAAPTVPLGTVIRRSSAAKSTARAASLAAARADDVELAVGPMRRMWEQCGQWSRRHGVSELMRLISASRAAARVRRYRTSFSSANEVISQARRFSGLSGRLRVNDKPRKGRSTQCAFNNHHHHHHHQARRLTQTDRRSHKPTYMSLTYPHIPSAPQPLSTPARSKHGLPHFPRSAAE